MTGRQQFINQGLRLFGSRTKLGKVVYSNMELSELMERQGIAEKWLQENIESPKYAEAVKRYEEICDEITFKILK